MGVPLSSEIVTAFHKTAAMRRGSIFNSDELMPISAQQDANTAAPGWVGPAWASGTLLVGINPGGGGDAYQRNRTDDLLYSVLREFRDAKNLTAQMQAFDRLSLVWSDIQRGHNIWRIIKPILDATGESVQNIAFMNILPFRTRGDAAAPAAVLRTAWSKAAEPQIRALSPKRIISLGKKAWDVIAREKVPGSAQLILFKRRIGDSYIPRESVAVLEKLRLERL